MVGLADLERCVEIDRIKLSSYWVCPITPVYVNLREVCLVIKCLVTFQNVLGRT